jgi:hypothetical protein
MARTALTQPAVWGAVSEKSSLARCRHGQGQAHGQVAVAAAVIVR